MKKIITILILSIFAINANASKQVESWWQNKLKNADLSYGYYEQPTTIVAVDKNEKYLKLLKYKDGNLKEDFTSNIIVGKSGQKLIEGDLKTPVGVYNLTARFKPGDTYLGPLAFSLSYPNILDKVQNRKGSGIWIHGYPLNGERTDNNTRGCIVLKNNLLFEFDNIIDYKNTITIVSENSFIPTNLDEISIILSELYRWQNAWIQSDLDWYLSFYSDEFIRYDGLSFGKFIEYKSNIFKTKERKRINFSKLSVTPYPNIKNEKIFVLNFHESYKSKRHQFEGKKTLYVKLENQKMKIIVER